MYGRLKNISSSLIKKFGSPCVVRIEKKGEYDPETGSVNTVQAVENKAFCIFDNLAYDFPSYRGDSGASMVKQGDVLIYLTAEAKPELNSHVVVNGETWLIVKFQPIKPSNTVIIYQCQARRLGG
ncbi:TPA: hypothetical protein SIC75_002067 [Pasteurella multocida]|uniref:hypothetical protein n=2 Tax=Pasteurella multocida TaxID=747 RepID=UPI0002569D11|nr:hypothetical protein [Pasteurella multocida]AFF25323.1 hypothetical protein PMCN06_2098 [Pasteurella multocida subsp. multocida str. HN06]AON59280.1 hypothetical protein AZI96_11310 [Pasteurella multocida]AUK27441.1 hypothetical protein A4205_01670 [Pasteurella multocida]AUK35068.1 hypothetical protein A4201_09410 [Pasteurella multocida]AUK55281.1 hypothetical protein A4209_01670 [Pasteurella multocida]